MTLEIKTCCPACGSDEAVPKSVAWDCAVEIPPKVARELDRLQQVELAANALIASSPHQPTETVIVVTVPLDLLKCLAEASGRELSI